MNGALLRPRRGWQREADGRFRNVTAEKIAKFDESCLAGRLCGQLFERLPNGENFQGILVRGLRFVEFDSFEGAALLLRPSLSGFFNQDAPHRLRCCGEKVTAMVELGVYAGADKAQVGFVNQRRRLKRLAGTPLSEFVRRELSKFVVDNCQ